MAAAMLAPSLPRPTTEKRRLMRLPKNTDRPQSSRILCDLCELCGHSSGAVTTVVVPEPVRDRIAPVTAEAPARGLHARRRLPSFVFGREQHVLRPADRFPRVAFARDVVDAAFLFDEPTQHGVEIGIFRQGVLVLLVRPQLGGWRLGHDTRRHHLAGGTKRPFRDTAVP